MSSPAAIYVGSGHPLLARSSSSRRGILRILLYWYASLLHTNARRYIEKKHDPGIPSELYLYISWYGLDVVWSFSWTLHLPVEHSRAEYCGINFHEVVIQVRVFPTPWETILSDEPEFTDIYCPFLHRHEALQDLFWMQSPRSLHREYPEGTENKTDIEIRDALWRNIESCGLHRHFVVAPRVRNIWLLVEKSSIVFHPETGEVEEGYGRKVDEDLKNQIGSHHRPDPQFIWHLLRSPVASSSSSGMPTT
jgi:hypothetical protein